MTQLSEAVSHLSNVVTPHTYQAERSHIFPSRWSIDWFIRRNKAELVTKGALVKLGNGWHFVPAKADALILEIGQRAAQKHMQAT